MWTNCDRESILNEICMGWDLVRPLIRWAKAPRVIIETQVC